MKPNSLHSIRRAALALFAISVIAVPAKVIAQTNALDWDIPANQWDYVGEIAPNADTISHTFTDVDGSGVDLTLQFDPVRGTVDTRSTDGTLPARDSLQEMLNADAAHTGIFNLFSYSPEATLNYGFGESDRDDSILSTFAFSGPVLDVTFDAIDIDKSNFVGDPGFEVSGQGDGWIDQLTITGYLNGQPVYPTFGTIPSGVAPTPATTNWYAEHGFPNPTDYVLVTGANSNILEGRWEFSEKGNFGTQPDDGGTWDTEGTYGSDMANVTVSFPGAIDSFTIQYANLWSVPGVDDRTTPDEYWGGHSQETGISDIGFTPYVCSLDFDDGAGGTPGYFVGDSVFVQAEDVVYNTDPGSQQSMTVTLTNDRTGESEDVTLLETGDNTGIFSIAGGFPTTATGSTANNDGTLNVQYGDTVTVTSLTGGTGDQCLDTYRFPVPTGIVKAVDQSQASEGDTLTYTIDVNYPAGDVLTGVTVTDSVPAGTTYVNGSVTAGGSESGGDLTWLLGSTVAGTPAYQAPGLTAFSALADATNDFGGQDSLDPSVAMDAAGKLHVAFVGKASGASKLNIYYTTNAGGAWSTPLRLSNDTDAQDALAPSIAVDAGGNVHVVYTDDTNDSKRNAYYVKASAGGGVLVGPTRLSSDVNIVLTSDVAVDGNGHVHVVFGDKTATDARSNAYYRVSTDGGTSFSAQERVSNDADGQDALVPAIAVSAAGTAHIVYTDDTSDAVRNVYYVAGTAGSFSVPQRLSDDTDGQAATAPAVAVDGSGHAHVAYGDKQAGDAKRNIYYTNNVGGGFATPVDATADFSGQDSSLPTVGVDVQGAAHLSFQNVGSDGGKIDIFYTNNQSGSFATPTQFTTNLDGQDSLNPDIAVGVNSVCVVFGARDPSDSKRNVYNTCADLLVGTSMSVSASPGVGTTGDTVTVTAVLTSTEDLTGVLPVLTPAGSNNMGVSLVAAPPAQNLTADTPAQFVWTYSITEGAGATPGQLTFQVAATNNDATFGLVDFGTADSNSFIATPPLKFQVTVDAGASSPIPNAASVQSAGELIVTGNPKCYMVSDGVGGSDNDRLVFVEMINGTPVFTDIGDTGTTHIEATVWSSDMTTLYVTDRDSGVGAGSDEFGTLDLSSGLFSSIGRIVSVANPLEGASGNFTVLDIDGLSFDPVSGDLYAISRRESIATQEDLLFKIDPATGQHVEDAFGVGVDYLVVDTSPLGLYDIDDISFNLTTGVLYGVANSPSSGGGDLDRLVTIDTTSGAVTDIGRITNSAGGNIDDMEGLSFDADGVLHGTTGNTTGTADDNSMWTIDPATAEATLVLALPLYEDYEAVACQAAPSTNGTPFIPPTASNEVQTVIGNIIGDYVWIDTNGDGVQDGTETGLNGVTVNLLNSDGSPTGFTTTTANDGSNDGSYEFAGVPDGSYIVEFVASAAYDISPQDNATGGTADEIDSDADPASGRTDVFAVAGGEIDLTFDAGMYEPVTISGVVEYDNGAGNQPLGGVTMNLLDGNGDPVLDGSSQPITVTTDPVTGAYSFTGLPPGTYQVSQTQPAGYQSTSDTDGANDNLIGDGTPITLSSGQSSTGNNFLEEQLGAITGAVLADDGNDGGGDSGIGGVTLTLLDASGNPVDDPNQPGIQDYVVTSDSGTGAYAFINLPAGDYQVAETQPSGYDSVSDVDGSDPDLIGDVTLIAVTAGGTNADNDFIEELPASLGDLVWFDLNGNGIQDGGAEVGLDGVLVRLLDADNGNAEVATVITSGGGLYLFEDLTPGNYIVDFVVPDGYDITLQDQTGTEVTDSDADPTTGQTDSIAIVRGDELSNVDAGIVPDPGTGSIGNYVWLDENGDGVPDAGEAGIAGVTVELLNSVGAVIATTTTDADGGYLFTGLAPGDYTIRIDGGAAPTGMVLTGDPDSTADNEHPVSLAAGEEYLDADFGYNWVSALATDTPGSGESGAIGNRVWSDADGDGVQDPGELGIPGVTLTLYQDLDGDGTFSDVVGTAVTDADGSYVFPGLDPGAYVVEVLESSLPADYTQSGDPDTTLDGATTTPIILAPGDVYVNADFGYQAQPAAAVADIGDTIYFDADASGSYSAAVDSGIAGVTVSLLDASGAVVATAITDSSGAYLFADVPTGADYTVVVTDTGSVLNGLINTGDPDAGGDSKSAITAFAATDLDQDFGYAPAGHDPGESLIGDTIFIDLDGDGSADPGEGTEGVTVRLFDASGTQLLGVTTTDENGNYYFGGLDPSATYTVAVDTSGVLSGLTNTVDPDTGGDSISVVDLSGDADGIVLTQDFGYEGANTISGIVWEDPDADGTRAGGETFRFESVTVGLFDTDGNLIGTTTTDNTGLYIFDNLPDGDYTVDVLDSGNVLDGHWHSLGSDSAPDPTTVSVGGANPATATIDFGYYLDPAIIGDFVWHDLNGDGDQDSGEPGIGGVEVTLTVVYATNDTVTVTTTTAPDGSYSFAGLLDEDFSATGGAGDPVYTVTVATPPGFAPTTSNAGAVADTLDSDDGIAGETAEAVQGGSDASNDFGFVQTASIGNYVWFDENGDGAQDAGEDGIPGVLVELHDEFGATIATTLTDADGGYLFTNVPTGVPVMVCVKTHTLPLGMTNQTGDPDATLDGEHTVTLSPGEEYMVADFGYNYVPASDTDTPIATSTGSIGDRIWIDADSDGVQDDGEAGLAGVEVKLYTDPDGDGIYDNLVDTTTTDVHGNYIFDDSPPDSYRVEVTPPLGYTQTGDPDGTLDDATSSPIILGPGDVYANADFGYVLDSGAADIGDKIYLDTDANGSFDGSEIGIAGVTVALTDGAGNVIATATTDADGNYLFPGLPSGTSYQVIVTDTDHVLGNLAQTGDPDTTPDGKSTVASLAPSGDLDQDFGYAPAGHDTGEGLIGDSVFLDTDNSGTLTAGEGIEGITVKLYDATGTTLITSTVTDENGNYWFGGLDPLASYTVKVDTTGALSGLVNTIDPDTINPGDSESLVDLSAGSGIDLDQDFGYVGTNDISGLVWLDPDADGTRASGETVRFGGVTVDLLDPDGNIVATTTTLPDGSYSFDNVPDGDYTVDITDDANLLAGYWHSLGTDSAPDPAPVTVNSGNTSATIDFGYYIELASVGNYVFNDANFDGVQNTGDTPISGAVVTLTVTYANGAVVTATTITAADGSYSFDNLLADEDHSASGGVGEPTFELTAATPAGLVPTLSNVGGDDTADSDNGVDGELAEIVQGSSDLSNDFGFTGIKPDSWTNWQTANAGDLGAQTGPAGNLDGDLSDNLLEYALCLDPETGSPHRAPNPSERGGFCLIKSGADTLDAFFTRPLGGLADVTYTLEVAAALGDPTAWTDVTTGITPTVSDNGDGTETVTYADLELLDGTTPEGIDLSTGIGFARLRVDLDDGTTTATSHTEVFGWSTLSAQAECETCSNPFAPKDVFSGTVTSATGNVLDVSDSAGTGANGVVAQMANRPHYIEIIGGSYEGHRFEVASATDQSITLAVGAPRNTLDPIPNLGGAPFVLRAHVLLDEIVTAADFFDMSVPTNNEDPATAGRLLFYDNVNGWSTYFAYDDSGTLPFDGYWTSADNSGLENVGNAVLSGDPDDMLVIIEPCGGFFVHPKAQAVDIVMTGVVRTWDFACPLAVGYNFIGSAYPLVQSPDDRDMSLSYFTGTPDPWTADQVDFWLGDGALFGVESYDSHFRVLSGSYDHWTTQENSSLNSENADPLFQIQRSAFIKSVNGNDRSIQSSVWLWPAPWAP